MPTVTGTPNVRFNCNAPKVARELYPTDFEKRSYPITAIMRRGETFKVPTGLSCPLPWWDAKTGRADLKKAKHPADKEQAKSLNKNLDEWETLLLKIWNENDNQQPRNRYLPIFTPNRFRHLVETYLKRSQAAGVPSFLEFVSSYIHERAEQRKKSAKDPWLHPTISQMVSEYKRLAAYSKQNGQPHWEEITPQWLQTYVAWLHRPTKANIVVRIKGKQVAQQFTKKALNKDSALQAVTLLKQFVRAAGVEGYVSGEAIARLSLVRLQGGETDAHFFHWREIKALLECDLSPRPDFYSLHRFRLLAFVGVFTGLRFSDYTSIKKESVYNSPATGEMLLDVVTKKKKKKVAIKFLPIFKAILDAANWQIDQSSISNYNPGLKELVKFAGIERQVMCNDSTGGISHDPTERPFYEVVSSHCARRTAAQFQAAMGASMNQIRKNLGHGAESMTAHYMASDDFSDAANVNSEEMEAMRKFLNGEADFSAFIANHTAYLEKKQNPKFENWRPQKHEALLQDGYTFHKFEGKFSTADESEAKKVAARKRKEGCFSRVFFGYEKQKGKILYSVVFKPKIAQVAENV